MDWTLRLTYMYMCNYVHPYQGSEGALSTTQNSGNFLSQQRETTYCPRQKNQPLHLYTVYVCTPLHYINVPTPTHPHTHLVLMELNSIQMHHCLGARPDYMHHSWSAHNSAASNRYITTQSTQWVYLYPYLPFAMGDCPGCRFVFAGNEHSSMKLSTDSPSSCDNCPPCGERNLSTHLQQRSTVIYRNGICCVQKLRGWKWTTSGVCIHSNSRERLWYCDIECFAAAFHRIQGTLVITSL